MIDIILKVRAFILKAYQKTRVFVNPVIKFIFSMMVFGWVNDSLGFDERFTSMKIVLLLSAVCAITPGSVLVFFTMVLSLLHLYKVSLILAVLLLVVYVIMYGLMIRFSPKQILAVVAIPVLAKYNLHYAVPMFLGCVSTPLSALPCACGIFMYSTMEIVQAASERQVEKSIDDIIAYFTDIADAVMANKTMFIMMVVFALVISVIFILRKFSFDYAFVIGLGAGVATNILGFLIADLIYGISAGNIGALIFMSLICGVFVYIAEFMKRVLDYTSVERVQFEDDDYYYYVKAVPKVNVNFPRQGQSRRISYDDDRDDGYDEPEDDYSGNGREYDSEYPGGYEEDYRTDTNDDNYGLVDIDGSAAQGDVRYEDFDDEDFGSLTENEPAGYEDFGGSPENGPAGYEDFGGSPENGPAGYEDFDGASDNSEVRYEDFGDDDFAEEQYSFKSLSDGFGTMIPVDDADESDEGYEVEMTLEDE